MHPDRSPLGIRPPNKLDFGYAHDVLCGLGGFTTAFQFLNVHTVCAVDWNRLVETAFESNHSVPFIQGDVGDPSTVCLMHRYQLNLGVQPALAAGIPCQPLSVQGHLNRHLDIRSATLPAVLRAALCLGSTAICLECVPEALHDTATQKAIHEYASYCDCVVHQRILQLHTVWPCRRTRWFALIFPRAFGLDCLCDLPVLSPPPVLGDLFPYAPWPVWSQEDESQLKWTELEMQAFRNPDFGSCDRTLDMQAPCPTALHSWGSVLYKCPCGCRDQGISVTSLLRKGLRGVEICSGLWPHAPRHIHPRELQVIMGFPPFEAVLSDCRAQLALFGNAVSPVQVIWIFGHVLHQLGMTQHAKTPRELLAGYLTMIVKQRNLTWPNPDVGLLSIKLCHQGTMLDVVCNTSQTVQDLVRAEQLFNGLQLQVLCEGFVLPPWTFLQERTYHIHPVMHDADMPLVSPVILEFLGMRSFHVVPSSMSYSFFLTWAGIHEYHRLVDENNQEIQLDQKVCPWKTVIVQMSPEEVELELQLRLSGLGLESGNDMGLQVTHAFECTGLWHLDQLVKSELLLSWAGTSFAHLVCWLPSFAAAVLELWPSTIDEHLKVWLHTERTLVYAIVWESWGWNLVCFRLEPNTLQVTFYEPIQASCTAAYLAFRVQAIASCEHYLESFDNQESTRGAMGTLGRVFELLEHALGLPPYLVAALRSTRDARLVDVGLSAPSSIGISPTLDYQEHVPHQMPFGLSTNPSSSHLGLTVKFVLDFAKALGSLVPNVCACSQIKVVVLDSPHEVQGCAMKTFQVACAPTWIFVLCNRHWTLVSCHFEASILKVVQYDGLGLTPLTALAPLISVVKQAWRAERVHARTTWDFPQDRSDSCGTVALAHFAFHIGAITYEQAIGFEALHASLAVCASIKGFHGPVGFGPDETAIVQSLGQILPAKGVPDSEVQSRAQAAIKAFGIKPIHQALQAKNPWAALKTLGNSRPKPFLWVLHHELQQHIQERAQGKFGALDAKRTQKKASKKESALSKYVDPASLTLPHGIFMTNCGTALPQLQLDEVQKDARGVAFATPADVQRFLADGKLISPDGLALLVIGPMPENLPVSLPMHGLRVPAIYKGTNEPVIIDCTSVQLGDQAVYRRQNDEAPEITVCPTKVMRAHAFKDLWPTEFSWEEFAAHPVRHLVQIFPIFRLCKQEGCTDCSLYHPSLEEEGVESGLLDIWSFRWHAHDGTKSPPKQAEALSVYIRIPESSFDSVHRLSGSQGCFFEPRGDEVPGPDDAFAVVWVPQFSLSDAIHRVRTVDHCIAVCRLGLKYGIRCLSKHQEELHRTLFPNKPFVNCVVKAVYRLEPLPAGTQRAALVAILRSFEWNAKPLQPCKGSQSTAWQVGAAQDPPTPFIETQHGWIGITKVKDATPQAKPTGMIATVKTRQHIQEVSTASASSISDPWQHGPDPWSGYAAVSKIPAAPSQHVQSRFDDVEQRLQDHVTATLNQEVKKLQISGDTDTRITAVESQIQSLVNNQTKLEHWVADGSSKVHQLQHDCQQLHQTVQSQGSTLSQVVSEVAQCTSSVQTVAQEVTSFRDAMTTHLEGYFAKQQEAIEAMLAKKARHT